MPTHRKEARAPLSLGALQGMGRPSLSPRVTSNPTIPPLWPRVRPAAPPAASQGPKRAGGGAGADQPQSSVQKQTERKGPGVA